MGVIPPRILRMLQGLSELIRELIIQIEEWVAESDNKELGTFSIS